MADAQRPAGEGFLRVGLTGGIASGKSAVADRFADRGVPVLDTDLIAREVVEPGTPGLARLVDAFGPTILDADGALDRAVMRERVFARPAERRRLEAIVHPLVLETLETRAAVAGGPYQILVIPLLVETGLADRVDRVLVVDCDPDLQKDRLLARDGGGRDAATQILAAQADRDARLAAADDVLVNAGTLDDLTPLVARLDEFYRRLAKQGDRRAPGIRLP